MVYHAPEFITVIIAGIVAAKIIEAVLNTRARHHRRVSPAQIRDLARKEKGKR